MDFDFNAVLENFRAESEEGFQQLEESLLALEQAPGDQEHVQRIFRVVHTIEGNASSLGMPRLSMQAHEVENVLGPLRDGGVRMTAELCSSFLGVVDELKRTLAAAIAGSSALLPDEQELQPAAARTLQSCRVAPAGRSERQCLRPA